jgi:hypothetical protein
VKAELATTLKLQRVLKRAAGGTKSGEAGYSAPLSASFASNRARKITAS